MKVKNGNIYLESNEKVITEKLVASGSGGLLLEDDSGNYVKINNGGIVNISKPSCASVYLGTNHNVSSGTRTKVKLDTEIFDVQGEFDNSVNYRFTATKAGYYAVVVQGCIASLADADQMITGIYKNGSIIADTRVSTGGAATPRFPVNKIIYLAVNDYIELWIYHNYGAVRSAYAGRNNTFLTIHKLS